MLFIIKYLFSFYINWDEQQTNNHRSSSKIKKALTHTQSFENGKLNER